MKLTKREYQKRLAALTAKKEAIQAKLAEADRTNGANLVELDDWNRLHDMEWQVEQDLRCLDREWTTRNWTASDWTQWNLIAMNID